MSSLTTGNVAKIYCLNWIENYIIQHGDVSILDLGCGDASNFVELLKKYPEVEYFGVDRNAGVCKKAEENLKGTKAIILNQDACRIEDYPLYCVMERRFDIVASFSVLEHIYRRHYYLASVFSYMKPSGYLLLNYDDGHFRDLRQKPITLIGQLLARVGIERWYQSEVDFFDCISLLYDAGLKIIDCKIFNTSLKGICKALPEEAKDEFCQRWLDLELWLNKYSLKLDKYFGTRNFICEVS